MPLHLRPAHTSDLDVVYTLRLRALTEDPQSFDQTVEAAQERGTDEVAESVAACAAGRDLVLLAELNDEPVGLLFITHSRRPRSQHRARLWGMWVAPEARERGVGTAMVRWAVDWCRPRRIELVDLWVVTAHTSAVRMYQRAGFHIVGTTPDGMRFQGQSQAEHQMVIQLPVSEPDAPSVVGRDHHD